MPVSFPFSAGITRPTALAAPVEDGIIFPSEARPPRQSLREVPSTVFCEAVVEWMVVIRPIWIPKLSLSTFASGARQFVVQEALEITFMLGS